MIGEKIKIGFDGSAVKRGLTGLMGGFSRLSRGIGRVSRQVGIGFAREAGATMFGTVLSALKAIPNELEGLARLNKELQVMNMTTGITTEGFLAMRQAISNVTGKDLDAAKEDLLDIMERVGLAREGAGPEAERFVKLGMTKETIFEENPEKLVQNISDAFNKYRDKFGDKQALGLMTDLMGDQAGKMLIPFFMNYGKEMDKAKKQTAGLATQFKEVGAEFESVFNIRQSIKRRFSEFSIEFLRALGKAKIPETLERFFESFSAAGLVNDIEKVIESINKGIKSSGGIMAYIWDNIKKLQAWISEAITNGIKDGIAPFLPSFGFGFKNKAKVTVREGLDWMSGPVKKFINAIAPEMETNTKITPPVEIKPDYEIFKPKEFKSFDGEGIEKNTSKANILLQGIKDNIGVARYT